MNKFSALLLCGLLAACGGGVDDKTDSAPVKQTQETVQAQESKSDFKPISYIDPKAEEICAKNGGLKGCYGFAFECNDGFKTKIDKVSCVNGQYVEDKPETVVNPSTAPQSGNTNDPQKFCKTFSQTAESLMSARQNGVPMSKAMEIAGDNPLMKAMVSDAYDRPAFSMEENKLKTIREFGDTAYSICWKSLGK